jgi:hypothetical protein
MPMIARLWSISSLALELERSQQMIGKALRAVPPDGEVRGFPAWLMKTALPAIVAYESASDQLNAGRPGRPRLPRLTGNGAGAVPDPAFARLERLASEIDAGMDQLRKAPADKRVETLRGFGSQIGQFDRAAGALGPFKDLILREIVAEVTGLLNAE